MNKIESAGIALFRFAVAFFAFRGTFTAWTLINPYKLIYFTTQTNILLGVVFLWAGIATLFPIKRPPIKLKGAVLLYILITGLVAYFILDPPNPNEIKILWGLTATDMVHIVTPILATIDFLLFDPHRQFHIRDAAVWLLYPVAYFIFILVIVGIYPSIRYPYPFIDLNVLSLFEIIRNVIVYSIGFFLLGLVIVGVDRLLPVYYFKGNNSTDL